MADFTGFYFDGIHSSTYHLIRTSDGDRYKEGLCPEFEDRTIELVGGDGSLYQSTRYKETEFTINIAFDSITEEDFRKIRQWLSPKGIKEFRFDERPYKVYYVKLIKRPEFEYVCFMEKAPNGTLEEKQRVYKGEATLNFIAYNPFGHCCDNSTQMTENGLEEVSNGINWQVLNSYSPFEIIDDNVNEWGAVSGLKNSNQLENYNSFRSIALQTVYLGDFDNDQKVDSDVDEKIQNYINKPITTLDAFKADYNKDGVVDDSDKTAAIADKGKDAPTAEYQPPAMRASLYNPGDFDVDFQLFIDLSEIGCSVSDEGIITDSVYVTLLFGERAGAELEEGSFRFSLKGLYKNSKILLNTKNHSLTVFYDGTKSLRYDLIQSTHWPKIPRGENVIKLQIGYSLGGKIPQIKYNYQYY